MSRGESVDRDRLRHLMMAALDGEISAEERGELERGLENDAEARLDWERVSRVKEVTRAMRFREPPEEVWDRYWTSVYNHVERGIGWILVSVGAIVLACYGAWVWFEALLSDTGLPLFLKLAIMALAFGLIILAVSVMREKLFTWRRDPYKEIER